MAEGVGFEPTRPLGPTVFKTAAFDRSATPPCPESSPRRRSEGGLWGGPGRLPGARRGPRPPARVIGAIVLAAVWLASGGIARLPAHDDLMRLLPVLAVQGAVLSFVGTLLWYAAVQRLDLARCTSIVVPSIPMLSMGASFLLLGEVASARQWIGLVLTVCGVLVFATAPGADGAGARGQRHRARGWAGRRRPQS